MAKTKISQYDSTAANNLDINSINIAEGMAPSDVNNAIRELMAELKNFQAGLSGDDLTVGGNLNVTGTLVATNASYLPLAGGILSGAIETNRATLAATATTTPLWTTANGNVQDWTGTPTITAFPNAPQAGSSRVVYPAAGTIITNGGNITVQGNASYTVVAGDELTITAITTTTFYVTIKRKDGLAVISPTISSKIQPFTATTTTNILTGVFAASTLDYRSATAATGTPNTLLNGSLSLAIPATSNLGMLLSGQSQRLIWLVAYNAGSPVLCVVNLTGGVNLDETGFISPTTIGASSNSANVIYSASAVSANSPYRVVGFTDVIFTTGTGWSSPTLVQGIGGQVLSNLNSFGYSQTNASVARTSGTTYYNTSNLPKFLMVFQGGASEACIITVDGVALPSTSNNGGSQQYGNYAFVPPRKSYSITATSGTLNVYEFG